MLSLFQKETRPQENLAGEFTGKLKYYCPTLYNSLTMLERDILDKSLGLDLISKDIVLSMRTDKGVIDKSPNLSLAVNLGIGNCSGQACINEVSMCRDSPTYSWC
jgi:hypothetical protein